MDAAQQQMVLCSLFGNSSNRIIVLPVDKLPGTQDQPFPSTLFKMSQSIKYAHLFKQEAAANDGSEEGLYLYVGSLPSGVFSGAQRVRHVRSGTVQVRKVRHHSLHHQAAAQKDKEVKVAEKFARTPVRPGAHPRVAKLLAHGDEPVVYDTPDRPVPLSRRTWARVSYWEFYNGDTLFHFIQTYRAVYNKHSDQTRPRFVVPLVLVARFVHHTLESLQFCQDAGVAHMDLSTRNIWLHWASDRDELPEFYLGDFNCSRPLRDAVREIREDRGLATWDSNDLVHYAKIMLSEDQEWPTVAPDSPEGPLAPLVGELARLEKAVDLLRNGSGAAGGTSRPGGGCSDASLPDLSRAIRLAREAEQYFSDMPPHCGTGCRALFEDTLLENARDVPRYYNSPEDVIAEVDNYTVPGPSYVARVDIRTHHVLDYERVKSPETEDEVPLEESGLHQDGFGDNDDWENEHPFYGGLSVPGYGQ
ncbi:hypothetical protein VTK73DRAFT_6933 [Phialemonium thermophilum]|uniref:Protein kinase domain-containing protein n=1 Tax=Phialemonium thermophilum TaxID=223376 RepID=A0ABR3WI35_9PEZI